MLAKATKAEYDNVLFDSNRRIEEKISWAHKERTVKLVSEGEVVAKRTTGRDGNHYQVRVGE